MSVSIQNWELEGTDCCALFGQGDLEACGEGPEAAKKSTNEAGQDVGKQGRRVIPGWGSCLGEFIEHPIFDGGFMSVYTCIVLCKS